MSRRSRLVDSITKRRALLTLLVVLVVVGAGAGIANYQPSATPNPPDVTTTPPHVVDATTRGGDVRAAVTGSAGETVTVAFAGTRVTAGTVGLESVAISFATAGSVELTDVTVQSSLSTDVPDAPADPLRIVRIRHTPSAELVESVTLRFSVQTGALSRAGLSSEDVVVYRYADGSWSQLPTEHVLTSGDRAVFEADSHGLSVFAVGGRPGSGEQTATETPGTTPTEIPATPTETPATPTETPRATETDVPGATPTSTATSSSIDADPTEDGSNDVDGSRPPALGPSASGVLRVQDPDDVVSDDGRVGQLNGSISGAVRWRQTDVDSAVLVYQSWVPDEGWAEVMRVSVTSVPGNSIPLHTAAPGTITYANDSRSEVFANAADNSTATRTGYVAVTAVLYDDGREVARVELVDHFGFAVTNEPATAEVRGEGNADAN